MAGYSLKKIQYIFIDSKAKLAWLWNEAGGKLPKLKPYPFDKVSNDTGFKSMFSFSSINGAQTVSLNLNSLKRGKLQFMKTPDTTLQVAFHEPFHEYFQMPNKWFPENSNLNRGTVYPADFTPRLYRAQAILNLKKTYEATSQKEKALYLSKAKFWFQKYQEHNKGEEYRKLRDVDIIEGTAKYADTIAGSISRLPNGCNSTEKEIRKDILQQLESDVHLSRPDLESYLIGMFSLLIMRDQEKKYTDSDRMNGHTPIELLLKNISPISEEIDKQLASDKTLAEAQYAQDIGRKMDTLKNSINSNEYVKISLPTTNDSFNFQQMISANFLPKRTITTGTEITLKSKDAELSVKNATVIHAMTNECGNDQRVVLVKKDSFKFSDGKVTFIQGQANSSLGVIQGTAQFKNTSLDAKGILCYGN